MLRDRGARNRFVIVSDAPHMRISITHPNADLNKQPMQLDEQRHCLNIHRTKAYSANDIPAILGNSSFEGPRQSESCCPNIINSSVARLCAGLGVISSCQVFRGADGFSCPCKGRTLFMLSFAQWRHALTTLHGCAHVF